MPKGLPVEGIALATYDKKPIPEKAVCDTAFPTPDIHIHFGLNGGTFNAAATTLGWNIVGQGLLYEGLGPRVVDIAKRGGRVAEINWFIDNFGWTVTSKTKTYTTPLDHCLTSARFDDFNRLLDVTSSGGRDLSTYPSYARMDGGKLPSAVGSTGNSNVRYSGTDKTTGNPIQVGTRWSKTALEYALRQGHWIEFHLDRLGDVKEILDKDGDYGYNVTARELRYLYRHWNRFKEITKFYNGYDGSGNVVETEIPWGDRPVPKRAGTDPTVVALSKVKWKRWCIFCCKLYVAGSTGVMSRWHACKSCESIRCDACGGDLRSAGMFARTRTCPCGGTTELV